MRTARDLVDALVGGLFEGDDVLTLDALEARQREFASLVATADRHTPARDVAAAIANNLNRVGQALRAEAFRL